MHDAEDRNSTEQGRALVVMSDDRVALATVLVLQEMDLRVDVAIDGSAAVGWAGRDEYEVIVCGPDGSAADLALRFVEAAPGARVMLLGGAEDSEWELGALGVDVIRPPLNVNTLVSRFWPAAA
jgi:hypothetical protein